ILAAELAAKGFTGPATVLEVEDGGYLRAFSDHWKIEPLVEGLGAEWRLMGTNFKPYACCGSVHAYVDAAKQIREKIGGAPGPAQTVRAGVAKVVDVQCGYDYRPGATLNSQMSLRYCLAVALLDGEALPAQFRDDRIADPAVTDLARRIARPRPRLGRRQGDAPAGGRRAPERRRRPRLRARRLRGEAA
ncbi:MAG: hypothetical protein RIM80_28250, partial [Alphaproteobacteria bacterium]